MTHNADESQDPLIDARRAQGVAFHLGVGHNYVNNNYFQPVTEPLFHDVLHSIDSANQVAAYELYDQQQPGLKGKLLTESCWSQTFFEQDFARMGAEYCAALLYDMRIDRAEYLLAVLTAEAQREIEFYWARRLVNEKVVDNARTRVKEWADGNPTRAAHFLWCVAGLPATEGQLPGPRKAIELLPDGPSFLLGLDPQVGAPLLRLLLPQPGAEWDAPPQEFAKASQIDAFLSRLAEINAQGTAVLLIMLTPREMAGYLSRLRLIPGACLLAWYIRDAPTVSRDELCQALSRPMLAAALKYIKSQNADFLPADLPIPRLSGWPQVDATLTLLVCIRHGVARLADTGGKFKEAARHEAKNLCHVWREARRATKDLSFYRRQRNHLAVLAAVFAVIVLLQFTIL